MRNRKEPLMGYTVKLRVLIVLVSLSLALSFPGESFAATSTGGGNCSNGSSGSSGSQCNTCISSAQSQFGGNVTAGSTTGVGQQLVTSIFTSINGVLGQISSNFYNGIIQNQNFQAAVNDAILMYIAIYGVLIMFGLAKVQTASEPVARLFKIALVWAIIGSSGWTFFSTYVGNLFLGGMNELIGEFQTAAGGTPSTVTITDASGGVTVTLDSNAVSALFSPMNQVFAAKYMVAMISLFSAGYAGPMVSGMMLFGFAEFILMIIGAIATYVKSLIGLAFLFGISPVFFACILFEKTRQVFMGWLNEVAAFSLQPVLLFGFLAFYLALINSVLTSMLPTTLDFCWLQWFSVPGVLWDVSFWRPVIDGNMNGGSWADNSGNALPPPISMLNCLYFLLLCSLGKNFCAYIGQITNDLTQGMGASQITGDMIKGKLQNALSGGKGPVAAAAGGAKSGANTIAKFFRTNPNTVSGFGGNNGQQ